MDKLTILGRTVVLASLLLFSCRSENTSSPESSQDAAPEAGADGQRPDVEVPDTERPDADAASNDGMVWLPEGYGIDATEVTRAAYETWLATAPSVAKQEDYCAWNVSFEPDQACMGHELVCQDDCGDHPQVCVDWCDAQAYCKGQGKRLCGKPGGGHIPWDYSLVPENNQWLNACSSHGANEVPYAEKAPSENNGGICNDSSAGIGTTVPVGSLKKCQPDGVYAGVFDLCGNVKEWIDACEEYEGFLDRCQICGGYYLSPPAVEARCDRPGFSPRHGQGPYLGFRCCSD